MSGSNGYMVFNADTAYPLYIGNWTVASSVGIQSGITDMEYYGDTHRFWGRAGGTNSQAYLQITPTALLVSGNSAYNIGSSTQRVRTVWTTNISSSTPIDSASYALTASYAPQTSLPDGVVSSSAQTIANITNQNVTLGVVTSSQLLVQGNLTVLGSSSIQYVTSSQLNIGGNKIVLNTAVPSVQFGGMSVVDSGSGQTTGSLYWDSLNNRWVYQREGGAAYNSAILISGPKNTGSLGNETGLIVGRVPVASGDDHIDTNTASSSIYIDFNTKKTFIESGLYVTGSISASAFTGSLTGELIGTASWASNAISASAATSITFTPGTASYAITASYATNAASGITGGTTNYIPLWTSTTAQSSSTIYQTAGNVGINTISPVGLLHVSGTNATRMIMLSGQTKGIRLGTDNIGGYIEGVDYTGVGTYQPLYLGGSIVSFLIAGSEKARIDSFGNVGIGTSSPGATLHIQGNVSASSFTGSLFGTASWAQSSNIATSSSFATTASAATSITFTPSTASFSTTSSFSTTASYALVVSGVVTNAVSASYASTASFSTTSSAATSITFTPTTASYSISSSFSTTASYALNVSGTVSTANTSSYAATASNLVGGTTNYIPLWTSATAQASSNIYQNGSNLGIGTTSPAQLLTVYSPASINQAFLIMAQTSGAAAIFTARTTANSTYFGTETSVAGSSINGTLANASFFANQSSNALQFGTNNNIRLTIDSSGNVGVGTTSPGATLQVQGNVSASSYTGSLFGTSSWANNAVSASAATSITFVPITASYSITSSYAISSSYSVSSSIADSIKIISGSGLYGEASYTGSISGSSAQFISITGSLFGTSSWALNAISSSATTTASFAITSSYVLPTGLPNGVVSSSVQTVANIAGQLISPAGISSSNNIIPTADNSYNLGSPVNRWANIYTGDLNLSNEGSSGNDIDGTTGNWTIQEGENNLYIINNKNGKKFKIMLTEIE